MPGLNRTLEQQRACYALECIRGHEKDRAAKEYGSLVRGLPSMVLQNGLGQALAFLLARAGGDTEKPPAGQIYAELQGWLAGAADDKRPDRIYSHGGLIDGLMGGSRQDYRRAQLNALALLAWMRKFADAWLPKGER
jgi:CRISPR-associated protein Cmr5